MATEGGCEVNGHQCIVVRTPCPLNGNTAAVDRQARQEHPPPLDPEGLAEDLESLMTLQKVTSSVPELGVAMIGSGLMAKSHTMGYRNVESVYGRTPLRPRFAILADAREDLARTG